VHAQNYQRRRTCTYNTMTSARPSCGHTMLRDSVLVQIQQTRMNTGRQSYAHRHFHNYVEMLRPPSVSTLRCE
jgi:hypothetical protein